MSAAGKPKPSGLSREYGEQFGDQSVVAAYRHRPEYPAATFDLLLDLIQDEPRHVLDIGCGTGFLTRNLAPHVDRLDAVDLSPRMVEEGKRLPGGDHANLRWIVSAVEDADLDPPYALITAGQSIHWMEWDTLLPRLHDGLSPNGVLALAGISVSRQPWDGELYAEIIPRYSTNKEYEPYKIIEELEGRGLFRLRGKLETEPESFEQSVEGYIESIHARNGFSRDRMTPEAAAAFDDEVRQLLARHGQESVTLRFTGTVNWGDPQKKLVD